MITFKVLISFLILEFICVFNQDSLQDLSLPAGYEFLSCLGMHFLNYKGLK